MAYGIVSSTSTATNEMAAIELSSVSGATATAGEKQVTLTWSDPENAVLSGAVLAKWGGTLVVRKEGSAPANRTDGTIIVDSKTRNQYASTGYVDTDVSVGTTYYYAFYPYSTAGGYSEPVSVSAVPDFITVTVPTLTGDTTFTYAPSTERTPTINNPDSKYVDIASTSTLSATDAGEYTITATLKDTTEQKWKDDTNTAKTLNWTINKATASITFNPTSLSLDADNMTKTSTITYTGDGTVSAQSADSTTATCSLSGATLTVNAVKHGSVNITVSATAGDNYESTTATLPVTVKLVDPVLNNNSWETISQVAQAGLGDDYWDVGDCKAVVINGTIGGSNTGTISVSNQTLYAFILDFNHAMNGTAENNIIFGGFKTALTGGTDVALQGIKMNSSNTNSGGWKGCDLRYEGLGNGASKNTDATTANLTSPRSNTFLAAIPAELRNVIRLWTRWIGKGNDDTNNMLTSVDAVTLLAECEIFASRSYANQYEKNYSTRMAYYTAGNPTIKYNHSSTSSAVYWWECSPYYSYTNRFCSVHNNGGANYNYASDTHGLAPAWKI